jgi:hypothetical protein
MTAGEVPAVPSDAFAPDISAPHVKTTYPTCNDRAPRRRLPLPPPAVPPLREGTGAGHPAP